MKKILSLLFLSSLIIFAGCGGDDDDNNDDNTGNPEVEILSPNDGAEFQSSDTIFFSGDVTDDAESEIIAENIIWVSNIDEQIGSGIEFSRILSAGEHAITLSYTDVDSNYASDDVSITVTSIGSAPEFTILYPDDGSRHPSGDDITFTGTATDAEDGTIDDMTWSSSIDGELGTGSEITTTLSIGNHTITLSGADSDENVGFASIEINIYMDESHELAMISEVELASAMSVAIRDNYAYVAGGSDGLVIIDITNPEEPVISGSADGESGNEDAVFLSGDYAYCADGGGLRIYDVSNPGAPEEAGFLLIDGIATGVFVKDNYAYVAAWEDGISIVEISDPTNPELVGQFTPASEYIANNVFVDGNFAYIAGNEAGIRIVDISDPTSPEDVSAYDTWGETKALDIVGNRAYVADGSQGLRIIDISDPYDPVELARFIDVNQVYEVKVIGNFAYLADVWQGMHVIDISYTAELTKVGFWELSPGGWALEISGDYAYVACNNIGLKIIDISAFDR
ncbi:MAG: LVIVD repeat-containing protein [Candidatus Zixiibacteriota bacterium]